MTLQVTRSTTPIAAGDDLFDERALVEQARTDVDAFALLYRRYLPRVYAFAYRRSGSKSIAEDVTSATFERALRSIKDFEWRGTPFEAWLFRIAANELASHYRSAARADRERGQRALRSLHSATFDDAEALDRIDRHDDLTMLRIAMENLNPRYQRVLTLKYLSGLSDENAARAMGVNRSLFAVLAHRATRALRREIDQRRGER